jgi:hypothetical protein
VEDVAPLGHAVDRATVRQKKTGQPVRFEMTEQTRGAGTDNDRTASVRTPGYSALNGDLSAVAKILGLWGMLPDHRPLTSVGLITPYLGLLPMQQIGQHGAVGDIGWRRRHRVDQQI